jgi:hypothetical protein
MAKKRFQNPKAHGSAVGTLPKPTAKPWALPLTALDRSKKESMTIQEIKKAYEARPFQAFDLHTADGRVIPVKSPEFLAFSPKQRCVYVGLEDGLEIVDLLLVTTLKHRQRTGNGRRH